MDPQAKSCRRGLVAILAASFALRAILIWKGCQFFFPDEIRYWQSRVAAKALWAGDFGEAWRALYSADHPLFKVIGVLPASLEIASGMNPVIPALFFALFSVASLWLTWLIVRRVGENERTAFFAVLLLALCSTFFYYSRYLLPYDLAMAGGLLAVYAGLRRPASLGDSVVCGLLAAATFLVYSGYWLLAAFALLAHSLRPPLSFGTLVKRGLAAGASFVFPLAAILAADHALGGNLLQQFVALSGSVNQGSFAEGWSLPLEYLWHAEHGLTAFFVAGILYAAAALAGGRQRQAAILGLAGILFVYGSLVVCSVVLEKFAVVGRQARQLVPFCAIVAALLLERIWASSRRGRIAAIALLALAAAQAGFNFRGHFVQIDMNDFRRLAYAVPRPEGPGQVTILNDEYFWPAPATAPAGSRVIFSIPHPLELLPLQYEGFSPDQRKLMRTTDISVRVVFTPLPIDVFSDGFESGDAAAWSRKQGGSPSLGE